MPKPGYKYRMSSVLHGSLNLLVPGPKLSGDRVARGGMRPEDAKRHSIAIGVILAENGFTSQLRSDRRLLRAMKPSVLERVASYGHVGTANWIYSVIEPPVMGKEVVKGYMQGGVLTGLQSSLVSSMLKTRALRRSILHMAADSGDIGYLMCLYREHATELLKVVFDRILTGKIELLEWYRRHVILSYVHTRRAAINYRPRLFLELIHIGCPYEEEECRLTLGEAYPQHLRRPLLWAHSVDITKVSELVTKHRRYPSSTSRYSRRLPPALVRGMDLTYTDDFGGRITGGGLSWEDIVNSEGLSVLLRLAACGYTRQLLWLWRHGRMDFMPACVVSEALFEGSAPTAVALLRRAGTVFSYDSSADELTVWGKRYHLAPCLWL